MPSATVRRLWSFLEVTNTEKRSTFLLPSVPAGRFPLCPDHFEMPRDENGPFSDPQFRSRTQGRSHSWLKKPATAVCSRVTRSTGYRVRLGDYRIIYTVVDDVLLVVVVALGQRRDVYEHCDASSSVSVSSPIEDHFGIGSEGSNEAPQL
jgi:mRNA interferase RelE/StbE